MSWKNAIGAALAGAALATCIWIPARAGQASAGLIAFDGDGRILTVEPDGLAVPQEIVPGDDFADEGRWSPDFSPDGTRVVFSRLGDGNWDVWTMGADGSNPVRLTYGVGIDYHPSWSPDGKRIAYVRTVFSGSTALFVTTSEGSRARRVLDGFRSIGTPEWSPDGRRIAFSGRRKEDADIFSVRRDGSGLRRLTRRFGNDLSPAWSPDGEHIAFAGFRRRRVFRAFVMAANGSGLQRVDVPSCVERCWVEDVEWSPGGTVLAVAHARYDEPSASLVTIDMETGAEEHVLTPAAPIRTLSWSS